MDGISRSRGWDKEIPHCVLPMEQLVLSDKWARKICPMGERYSCVRYAVCPVVVRFVRFSCVPHPVGILYVCAGWSEPLQVAHTTL